MKYRFYILTWSVFGVVFLITWKGLFYGDFWEHSTVIRELSTNLFNPVHPQLALEVTHVFYSPYAFMVALIARIFQLSSINALSLMVVVNYWLFVFGLRLFVKSIYPQNYQAVLFYSLLLIFFWWGWNPWPRSAFYHLGSIVLVMSYPSAFCTAISFVAIYIYRKWLQNNNYLLAIPVIIIASFVVLSHPPNFIFLVVMLVASSVDVNAAFSRKWFGCVIIIGLAGGLALLWPYFSIFKLAMGQSIIYHQFNTLVYKGLIIKAWPAYLGIALIIFKKRYGWRNQFVVAILILSAVYSYGYISGMYGYGRVLSFIILLLHVVIAENFAEWEGGGLRYKKRLIVKAQYVCASVIICCVILSAVPIARVGYFILKKDAPYTDYEFLSKYVGQYDVILSDIESNWFIPSFGGKVIAVKHPIAFVTDHEKRRQDVKKFFKHDTSANTRSNIITNYGVDYILLKKDSSGKWNDLIRSIGSHGKVIYDSDKEILFKII